MLDPPEHGPQSLGACCFDWLLQEARVNWAFQKEQKEEVANHFHVFVGDLSSGALRRVWC